MRILGALHPPLACAATQNNLGAAYSDLPVGDRGENLKKAIECYEAALRVRTETDFPQAWANTMCNLGLAWWDLADHSGDRQLLGTARDCFLNAARGYRAVGNEDEARDAERQADRCEP